MYCIVSSKYCILLKGASCWQKTMDLLRIGFLVKLAFLSLWTAISFTVKSL